MGVITRWCGGGSRGGVGPVDGSRGSSGAGAQGVARDGPEGLGLGGTRGNVSSVAPLLPNKIAGGGTAENSPVPVSTLPAEDDAASARGVGLPWASHWFASVALWPFWKAAMWPLENKLRAVE